MAYSFTAELLTCIPSLTRYACRLTRDATVAEDLVQDCLARALSRQDRFEPGTSMRAWTFVILRNAYLTDMRRNRFRGEYDEGVAERILTAPAGQEEPIHLSDLHRALLTLPPELAVLATGPQSDPDNPLFSHVGENALKGRVRSHLDVAQRFYPEHFARLQAQARAAGRELHPGAY
jgi:hypothetical protein